MSVDQATLQQQLEQLPDSARWAKRPEVEDLAPLLQAGEIVRAGVTGWLIESGKLAMRTWVILATTERLICLRKAGATLHKVEVPVSTMRSSHTESRLGYHEVIIQSSSGKMIVSGMPKDAAVTLSSALAAEITRRAQAVAARRSANAPAAQPAAAARSATAGADSELLASYVEKVKQLEADLEYTKKRLTAVEDVLRRAAARSTTRPQP